MHLLQQVKLEGANKDNLVNLKHRGNRNGIADINNKPWKERIDFTHT
jgi:hypothetical protein